MSALTKSRAVKPVRSFRITLPSTAQQVYKGGTACLDTSTGLVAKGTASTTLFPIGTYVEDALVPASGSVTVELFRELRAIWFVNSTSTDQITQTECGSNCYIVDDQTVAKTSNSNARSIAGRVWRVDPVKGVLVEFAQPT